MSELPEEVKIFLVEAYENLDQVEQHLVQLEDGGFDQETVNSIFRSIHTIKGNSGFLAFPKLEQVCHKGETLLDKLRNSVLEFSPSVTTALLEMVDSIRSLLENIEGTGAEGDFDPSAVIENLSSQLGAS